MCQCANCDPEYLYEISYPNGGGPADRPAPSPAPVNTTEDPWGA